MLKNLFKILIIGAVAPLNCFAFDVIGSYGNGISSQGLNTDVKAFNLYAKDEFYKRFFHQVTLTYLQDNHVSDNNGNYFTLGVFYGAGASLKVGYVELSGSLSLGFITKTDNTYLGGEFPQFNEVVMLTLSDELFPQKVGISFSHISSADFAGANQGRDILSLVFGYTFN